MANQQPHAPKAAASSTPAHTTPQAVPAQGGGRSLMGEIAANAASTAVSTSSSLFVSQFHRRSENLYSYHYFISLVRVCSIKTRCRQEL